MSIFLYLYTCTTIKLLFISRHYHSQRDQARQIMSNACEQKFKDTFGTSPALASPDSAASVGGRI